MRNSLLLLLLLAAANARALPVPIPAAPVDRSPDEIQRCKAAIAEVGQAGGSTLSKEMIELELAGFRWPKGAEGQGCLKADRFKYIRPGHVSYSDFRREPEYLLKKGREVTITKEKWIDDGSVEVSFIYIGTSGAEDVSVGDRIVYTINYGERRKLRGCASFLAEPAHFVMREECRHPDKKPAAPATDEQEIPEDATH